MIGIFSKRLMAEKEKILEIWEERCVNEVASAGRSASLALRDSLPLYLDHLAEALATNLRMDFKAVFSRDQEGSRIGRQHGADRAGNRSYILTEVIFEYHILREVLFQVLESEGPIAGAQRDIILDSIDQAVNDAAVSFSEIHTDIQQKFVNTLTHDLKNPISAAKMSAEFILRQRELPAKAATSATRVITNMSRIESMINDLLDASRLRAGQPLVLQFKECDLALLARDVVDEMNLIYDNPIAYSASGVCPGQWGSDGIRRAIENLVGNAVKYGSQNTPITVSLRNRGTSVELAVHNLGAPIAPAELALLFQDFHRSKSAQEGTKTGWGLGLTLVKGVVEAHRGKVRVESAKGDGTRFILELASAAEPGLRMTLSETAANSDEARIR